MKNFIKNCPIAFYENRYIVYENGKILNLANNTFLNPIKNPNGYYKVGLADGNGSHKQMFIHRLVANHFIPNPYNFNQINHKDGDKSNNHVTNLEWCSSEQNIKHAFKTGLRKGYMSANDKEFYLNKVLSGVQVKDLAKSLGRRPETLHKMLRDTAKRLNIHDKWVQVMRENRKNAAIRNLSKINT